MILIGSGHSYEQNSGHCPTSQIINLQVLETGFLPSGARGAVSPIPPNPSEHTGQFNLQSIIGF